MAFLMVVLLIHSIANVIGNKTKKENKQTSNEKSQDIKHPAEFLLR